MYGGSDNSGKAAHDGQTEAEALNLLMASGDGTIELVEDLIALLCRYASAGIGEDNERVAVLTTGREAYLATLVTVFRGIGDEVTNYDAQGVAVGVEGYILGGDVHLDMYAATDNLIGIGTAGLAEKFTYANIGGTQLKMRTVGTREHEHVIDHTVHIVHHANVLLDFPLIFLLRPWFADEHFQRAFDDGQRRTQFVRGVAGELPLTGQGFLQGFDALESHITRYKI